MAAGRPGAALGRRPVGEQQVQDFLHQRRQLGRLPAAQPGPGDLQLGAGNDWFVVPYELPVNAVSEVRALVITDVFGDRTLVPAADDGESEDWRRWSLFELGRRGERGRSERRLLLPSALGEDGESEPLERVQLVREEMANMVWAIEEVIPDATGRGIDGYVAADKTGVEPEEIIGSPAEIRYLLGTTVPEN